MLPPRLKPVPKVKRMRCPAHLAWVRTFACSVPGCAGKPIEAAHVRTGTDGGVGMKPGDQWAISLCSMHHRKQHLWGERTFGQAFKIDMKALAQEFAAKSPHRRKLWL